MRRPIGQTLAESAEAEAGENCTAKTAPRIGPTSVRNGAPERPSAAYLRHLILGLTSDTATPIEMQADCVTLMRAINANDLTKITELVARLGRLADAEGFTLPRLDSEAS